MYRDLALCVSLEREYAYIHLRLREVHHWGVGKREKSTDDMAVKCMENAVANE